MTKHDVLIMAPPRDAAMAQLTASYRLHRYDQAINKTAFLAEFGARCEAVVTNGHTDLTASHLDSLPNVRIVACSSAGYETIDTAALAERGIALTNSSDALLDDVADLALLLTLAARRQLIQAHNYVQSGDWERNGMYPLLTSAKGKNAGIVGLGQIGQAIARRFEPLGLNLGYTARSQKNVSYHYYDDTEALASWADILVVVLPGGPTTEGLISRPVMEALGSSGTLINVGRGSVVDETALIELLRSGQLGSAGLDVYRNEPNPNPSLLSLQNVVMYPHHASGTVESREAMAQTVVDNLLAHFQGQRLPNLVSLGTP